MVSHVVSSIAQTIRLSPSSRLNVFDTFMKDLWLLYLLNLYATFLSSCIVKSSEIWTGKEINRPENGKMRPRSLLKEECCNDMP